MKTSVFIFASLTALWAGMAIAAGPQRPEALAAVGGGRSASQSGLLPVQNATIAPKSAGPRVYGQPDEPTLPAPTPPVTLQGIPTQNQPQQQPAPQVQAPPSAATTAPPASTPSATPELQYPVQQPQTPQDIVNESLRMLMPLDEGHIKQYRQRVDQRDRAMSPAPPSLGTRTVRVSLEPGRAPVTVNTTANVATSIVFHDSTGKAWPISSVTNGGSSFFQVLRPDVPEGNLLNIVPLQNYASTSMIVTLEGKDVPLVIRLDSDGIKAPSRQADGMVLFQLAHHGPNAKAPVIASIKETVSTDMLSFLDRVPPKGAVRIRVEPAQSGLELWKLKETHYLRTSDSVVWPAWQAVVNGAGDVKCYEMPPTSRILLSVSGKVVTVRVKDSFPGEEK